jgi:ATP-dependent DNA ligase
MTARCRELAALADPIKAPVILDGEIAAPRAGRPDPGMLQSRKRVGAETRPSVVNWDFSFDEHTTR